MYGVHEPAHTLLTMQIERHEAAQRLNAEKKKPEWIPEIHDGPNCFPD
jgi:hypothetical protein